MIPIKTPAELDRMRAANRLAAEIRERLAAEIRPGVRTGELDEWVGTWLEERGARSAFKGYRGYPGRICVSVNEEVVHGIPGQRRIRMGDIVSVDVGVVLDGFVGDTAMTVMVGVSDLNVMRLVQTAEQALAAGVDAARPGNRVGDISHAVEQVVTAAGFSVVRDFVGHGIGRSMHEDPQIPNFGPPGKGAKLRPGMTLAIEPMVNLGRADVEVLKDGWTVVTRDGTPSAHVEHTVAVSPNGPEVLTKI